MHARETLQSTFEILTLSPAHQIINFRDSGCGLIGYSENAIMNFSYTPGQTFGFTIKTIPAGYNSGRVYIFRASDSSIRDGCISVVLDACNHAKQAAEHHKKRKWLQAQARRLVRNSIFKIVVAGMILATFFLAGKSPGGNVGKCASDMHVMGRPSAA